MQRWKRDFINYLERGQTVEYAARLSAGLTVAQVHDEREDDPDFAAAWDAVSGGDFVRQLTPAALEPLLWAQVPDDDIAAFFSLTHEQFTSAIERDPSLKRIYASGRRAGLAALRRAQFDQAIDGDKAMLTWLGKQHLGQADKADERPAPNLIVNFNVADPADSYRRLLAGGSVDLPATPIHLQIEDAE